MPNTQLDTFEIDARTRGLSQISWTVEATLPVRYSVVESPDLFALENPQLLYPESKLGARPELRRLVFVDSTVAHLHGRRIQRYFEHHLREYRLVPITTHESLKSMHLVELVINQIVDFGVARRYEPIIVIGGGVLMDIVGFAASLYRRGLPYIRVPTTLLGIVDAGIGVKTGVNFKEHKNRTGSYYAPAVVFLDRSFLQTLDQRHIRNGVAEILKMAIVKNLRLFELLEEHGSELIEEKFSRSEVALEVIRLSIQAMLEELEPNLWEKNLERLVDFGHTFSPAIEMRGVMNLLHGEAVAIDMCLSAVIAEARGLLNSTQADRILRLTEDVGLPLTNSVCDTQCFERALDDTKQHRDGRQRIPLPMGIGRATFFDDLTLQEVNEAACVLALRANQRGEAHGYQEGASNVFGV